MYDKVDVGDIECGMPATGPGQGAEQLLHLGQWRLERRQLGGELVDRLDAGNEAFTGGRPFDDACPTGRPRTVRRLGRRR